MQSLRDFDPQRVAILETQMWKAYYSHSFVKLSFTLLHLFKEQFHVNFFVAVRLGFYSARAAAVFRKIEDHNLTRKLLAHYYQIIEKHAQESFDPLKAAELELDWWLVHRYPNKSEKSLTQALADAMTIIYEIEPSLVMKYAEHRTTAMRMRDEAAHTTGAKPNWPNIEAELLASYSALKNAVNI